MKVTCRTLSLLLLLSLSCVAAQRPGAPTTAAKMSTPRVDAFSFDTSVRPFQITGVSSGLRSEDLSSSNGALPLLSCIGAGMALGGLLSARWWENRDK